MFPSAPNRLTLITNKKCPFAQKAWIALREAGLDFDLSEVSLYGSEGKPEWFLNLNSSGYVPVLVEKDGQAINESDRIVNQCNPTGVRDQDEAFANYLNEDLLPSIKRAVLSSSSSGIQSNLKKLETTFLSPNPYFSGESFGNSDIRVLPFIQRIESEYGIPEDCGEIREWWEKTKERESYKGTIWKDWWWWW